MGLPEAARLIEASPDFRLLRRVPALRERSLKSPIGETRRGVFVDTETTGLDPDTDEVIELALLPFEYKRDTGAIVRVNSDAALSAFRQPSFPIPPESSKIHGITDEMVAGQVIDPDRIRALIEPAHLVLAHNAAFDRPMVEKHWRLFEGKHWACSFAEIAGPLLRRRFRPACQAHRRVTAPGTSMTWPFGPERRARPRRHAQRLFEAFRRWQRLVWKKRTTSALKRW